MLPLYIKGSFSKLSADWSDTVYISGALTKLGLGDSGEIMINDMKNNSQVKYTFEKLNDEWYGRGWFGTYYLCDEPWQMQLLMDLFALCPPLRPLSL